jgi:DNA polymerase I-like protein with 3'-5' exonuclease and polymerase domains
MQGVTRRLNDATASGSIRTLKGRKCRFELWEPDDFKLHKALPYKEAIAEHGSTCRLKRAFSYKALNRLLQSSSADQVKMSMQLLFEQGVIPLLQVHDELCFSVKNKEEAQKHAKIMETAVELALPSRCDIEIGPSWGETR